MTSNNVPHESKKKENFCETSDHYLVANIITCWWLHIKKSKALGNWSVFIICLILEVLSTNYWHDAPKIAPYMKIGGTFFGQTFELSTAYSRTSVYIRAVLTKLAIVFHKGVLPNHPSDCKLNWYIAYIWRHGIQQ